MSAADIRPLREREIEFRVSEILREVQRQEGNICKAARVLGVHRNTIYREFRMHNIPLEKSRLLRLQFKFKFTCTSAVALPCNHP